MKILFDASIHLGQFCTSSEAIRIACKNSQASITTTQKDGNIAFYTFNENGWMDKIIWNLDREPQDSFYPFMDIFYSVTNTHGVDLHPQDIGLSQKLQKKFPNLHVSNALSCAAAVRNDINEIHTLYPTLLRKEVVDYMSKEYKVCITTPESTSEKEFINTSQGNLEELYQRALKVFRDNDVDLITRLHE